ncbi:hypothetical protein ACLIJR_15915 [Hydrogenophaga sp. XSHU_21]
MPVSERSASTPLRGCMLLCALIAGCTSVRPYPTDGPPNLQVDVRTESGPFLRNVDVAVDIHRVSPECRLEHLGRRQLTDPVAELGLPVGVPLYLEFIFLKSGRFVNDSSVVRHDTLLTVRGGHRYTARIRYLNGLYEVVMHEAVAGQAMARSVERQPLDRCVPANRSETPPRRGV